MTQGSEILSFRKSVSVASYEFTNNTVFEQKGFNRQESEEINPLVGHLMKSNKYQSIGSVQTVVGNAFVMFKPGNVQTRVEFKRGHPDKYYHSSIYTELQSALVSI